MNRPIADIQRDIQRERDQLADYRREAEASVYGELPPTARALRNLAAARLAGLEQELLEAEVGSRG